MKIIHVIESIDDRYGGPAKSVPDLIFRLNLSGTENEIVSTKVYENESNALIEKHGIVWKSFSIRKWLPKIIRYSSGLSDYLKYQVTSNPGEVIFHTHNFWNYPIYVVYKLVLKHEIPLVVSLRGSLKHIRYHKYLAWHLFQKKMLNSASAIHVTNQNDEKLLRDLGITTPVIYIPNGIDLGTFEIRKSTMEARKSIGVDPERKYILFLSRLHIDKGLDLLVKEWSALSSIYPNWDLLVAGPIYSRKYVRSVEQKIEKENLSGRVKFLGMVVGQEKLDVLAASNLLVLPSKSENFGNVIAEALACGLPVITTKATPWAELRQFNAGWWIEREGPELRISLNDAMSRSSSDLEAMGKRGKELVKRYDVADQSKKFIELYGTCLGRHKSRENQRGL
ncbi:MAG: glycosyltransferase [Gammaproteobacteria bacterium]|nr:glycosyltransferase [Gammaproteobacteria bacterium]